MSVNPRFEVSSSSPDGVSIGYSNIQRSHFAGGPHPERGSSLRDNHDSRPAVQAVAGTSLPGSGNSGRGELQSLSQVLWLDKLSSGEHKYGLKRAINAAVGLSDQDQMHGSLQSKPLEQHGPEELKRIKANLEENAAKARERSRVLLEAMSKLDKFRASTLTRKRVRSEPSVHERPITSLSVERPAIVGNSMKASLCTSPNHVSMADSTAPKPDDKNKGNVPSKRVRTSMVDVRHEGRMNASSFQRSVGMVDREKDSLKSTSYSLSGLVEEKDRTVSAFGEGWEKTKMKGRRSGTKSDAGMVTSVCGKFEIERDRSNSEFRSRPSEGHGFRSGPVHGVISLQKMENAQQNGMAMRSVNRSESDAILSVGEKSDRFVLPEKERLTSKNVVKPFERLSHREDALLPSARIVAKTKASRAPRSSAMVSVNPSADTSRPSPLADMSDHAPSRAQLPIAPSNRKRPVPASSSSPPVAQWVGQRPPKMARIARRITKDDAVSIGDSHSAHDVSTMVAARSNSSTSAAAGFDKKSAHPLSKLKPERVSSSMGLSESDDSECGGVKFKGKGKKHGDSECKFAPVNQKMGHLVLPGKKSKEEVGDGIRRQGRSGRGLIAGRESYIVQQVEKTDASANAKDLRSARPGVEKIEKFGDIKPGRPSTKKGAVDRKHLTRPRRPAASGGGDISGASDDDHEELVASVKATLNASAAGCPNDFWKELEVYFSYLTPDDHDHLKKQVRDLEQAEASLATLPGNNERVKKTDAIPDTPTESSVLNRDGKLRCVANDSMAIDGGMASKVFNNLKNGHVGDVDWQKTVNGDWPEKGLPLCQRLLSALIIDDDSDVGSQDELQECTKEEFSNDVSDVEQLEGRKQQDSESEVETRRGDDRNSNGQRQSPLYSNLPLCNGNKHSVATNSSHKCDESEEEDTTIHLGIDHLHCPAKAETVREGEKDAFTDPKSKENQNISLLTGVTSWDVQYQSLKLDDRIVLELQSVGLYADPSGAGAREDGDITEELIKSHRELKDQVHSNKEKLMALEELVSKGRDAEERYIVLCLFYLSHHR